MGRKGHVMDPEARRIRNPLIHGDPKPPPVTSHEVHPRDRRNHFHLMPDRKRPHERIIETPERRLDRIGKNGGEK